MHTLLSRLKSDYHRHGRRLRQLSLLPLAAYAYGQWADRLGSRPARWIAGKLHGALQLAVELGTACEIPREARIGAGLLLPHGHNVRIAPGAVIGANCCIFHDVVIGTTKDRAGVPTIGDNVHIGTGAKILGPVRIGDNAVIAPNSLVIGNVPAHATAIGVPARIIHGESRAAGAPVGAVVSSP